MHVQMKEGISYLHIHRLNSKLVEQHVKGERGRG